VRIQPISELETSQGLPLRTDLTWQND